MTKRMIVTGALTVGLTMGVVGCSSKHDIDPKLISRVEAAASKAEAAASKAEMAARSAADAAQRAEAAASKADAMFSKGLRK